MIYNGQNSSNIFHLLILYVHYKTTTVIFQQDTQKELKNFTENKFG